MKNKIKICGGYVKVGDYAVINQNYFIRQSIGKKIKVKEIDRYIVNMSGHVYYPVELSTVNYYKKNKK